MTTVSFSKFVRRITDDLSVGILSPLFDSRIERLLEGEKRFARKPSLASVIAIGLGLFGTISIATHSPAWVAYAQTPRSATAVPVAPPPPAEALTRLSQEEIARLKEQATAIMLQQSQISKERAG